MANQYRVQSVIITVASLTIYIGSSLYAADVIEGPIVYPANGYEYYLLSPDTWTASEAKAVSLGGHLATIRNGDEDDWIFNTFGLSVTPHRSLFIGLTDAGAVGQYRWASGEPVSYLNWTTGQPDHKSDGLGNIQSFVRIVPNTGGFTGGIAGKWDDTYDDDPSHSYGVVEIAPIPEPSSLALLVFGVSLTGARRAKRNRVA